MKYVPKSLTRYVGTASLKLSSKSPTIMVVTGVVGLGAAAVLAAKATRGIDPILDHHHKSRIQLEENASIDKKVYNRQLLSLYTETTVALGKVYAPAIAVGTMGAVSVLYGHKILQGRHVAVMAAYSGLSERFEAYRGRVAKTLGADVERGIYEGAHGEWKEDPDHPGEAKLAPVWGDGQNSHLRPIFNASNNNWVNHAQSNYHFLKGAQNHLNNVLQIRGWVSLNEALDAIGLPMCKEGQAEGWVYGRGSGDDYIDFGFMTGRDPQTVLFRNHQSTDVHLNFNTDGIIWDLIP